MPLKDAKSKFQHAVQRLKTAEELLKVWHDAGNLQTVLLRDPQVCQDQYLAVIYDLPDPQVVLAYADFFSSMQSALDYLSWSIYLAGGGEPTSKEGRNVYFPILTSRGDSWEKLLKKKVPTAWPEVSDALRGEQDDQMEGHDNTLEMLSRMANSQKHRALHMLAVSDNAYASAVVPALPDGFIFSLQMYQDRDVLEPMSAYPLSGYVISREGDPDAVPVPRGPGLEYSQPKEPTWRLALTDGENVMDFDHADQMVYRVHRIITRLDSILAAKD